MLSSRLLEPVVLCPLWIQKLAALFVLQLQPRWNSSHLACVASKCLSATRRPEPVAFGQFGLHTYHRRRNEYRGKRHQF